MRRRVIDVAPLNGWLRISMRQTKPPEIQPRATAIALEIYVLDRKQRSYSDRNRGLKDYCPGDITKCQRIFVVPNYKAELKFSGSSVAGGAKTKEIKPAGIPSV